MPNYGTKGDLLDMYDINRRPLGYTKGYFEKREAGEFFLASHVWIINDKKQFLIQKGRRPRFANLEMVSYRGCGRQR